MTYVSVAVPMCVGTSSLARLSLLSMLNHEFVIEAKHGHESTIT